MSRYGNGEDKKENCRETEKPADHGIPAAEKIFVFAVLFAASASIIEIDTQAGSSVGNEPFFTSSFIRKNSREVEVKIMGYEVLLSGGIASELEEES